VERLPDNVQIAGNLFLAQLPYLEELPPGLRIGGNLTVRDCRRLRDLPAELAIRGVVDLGGCEALARLPRGLRLGGLNVRGCPSLRSLPEDLEVAGDIEVAGAGITLVPPSVLATARFRWKGVRVPAAVIFQPETLPPERVLLEPNAEVRRVMLDKVGLETIFARADMNELDRDTDAGGDRQLVELRVGDSPWVARGAYRFLVCRCPSTGRRYLLQVPPDTMSCHAAAAWIAGCDDPATYRPVHET